MNATIKRETLNGTKWQIVADKYGAALYMHNFGKDDYHFSGYWFHSIEEAQAHLDAIDARVRAQREFIPAAVPADYYNDCNRYYGD